MTETILDVRGLNCPMPVLKAKRALKDLPPGAALRVLTTDPGAVFDFPAFCETTGDTLLEASEAEGTYSYLIRRAS